MVISGEEAARFNAVRLDSYANVNKGDLVEADDDTGLVRWKDQTGEIVSVTLGAHIIRITRYSGADGTSAFSKARQLC